jgi:hypothetical protein
MLSMRLPGEYCQTDEEAGKGDEPKEQLCQCGIGEMGGLELIELSGEYQ